MIIKGIIVSKHKEDKERKNDTVRRVRLLRIILYRKYSKEEYRRWRKEEYRRYQKEEYIRSRKEEYRR